MAHNFKTLWEGLSKRCDRDMITLKENIFEIVSFFAWYLFHREFRQMHIHKDCVVLCLHSDCLWLCFWLFWLYSNISFRALGPGMQFQHKLHIVYLVNDILHHCQRKGAQDLKKSLEDIIVPLFFCTQIGESPENLQKVTKVLGIWESHNLFEASLLQVCLTVRYQVLSDFLLDS